MRQIKKQKKETVHTILDQQTGEEEEEKEGPPFEGNLLCKRCHLAITHSSHGIAMQGSHQHTFFNPHGLLFLIGCFRSAPGCRAYGAPSSEFSWFRGFSWQIVLCAQCRCHLGWQFFKGEEPPFFGLILTRLHHGRTKR